MIRYLTIGIFAVLIAGAVKYQNQLDEELYKLRQGNLYLKAHVRTEDTSALD